ncbi:MAG: Ku protein [Deltaproteobacteria bacterium]|nr:Ku protein [Deltaproteobacteria bacterium]
MRAIWKGYLKFSLVSIPVKMYTAVTRRGLSFDLLHKECGTKIKQERYCPHCQRVVSSEELVRGYKYGKDLYIPVTEEDFAKAEKESTDALEILKFVDEGDIPPIYYADSHYLVPDGQAGVEAFALLHRTLKDLHKSAVAKVVMRHREYIFALRPCNGALIAYTLHFPEEIMALDQVAEAREVPQVKVDEKSLRLAKTLVANLSGRFIPEEYTDDYSRTLLNLIRAKAEGQEYQVEAKPEGEKVISLMEALEALRRSVELAAGKAPLPKKGMATAGHRRREARKKRKTG